MEGVVSGVGDFLFDVGWRGKIGEELPEPAAATIFAFTVVPVDRDLSRRVESLKNILPLNSEHIKLAVKPYLKIRTGASFFDAHES
jgi:hypothetical protein